MKSRSIFFALILAAVSSYAQTYSLVNAPTYEGGSCFSMVNGTNDATAVWGDYGLYLPSFQGAPLTAAVEMYFGLNDGGGHGLAFVIQQKGSSAIGAGANSLGYGGSASERITNSVALEFDTYSDAWDASLSDHMAINFNGNEKANDFGPLDLPNLEDGTYHDLKVFWTYNPGNPAMSELKVVFDGLYELVANFDPASVFVPGQPIYLGVTSGVDALINNDQKISIGPKNDPGTCSTLLLPVEYLFFKGEQKGGVVRLDWATSLEVNNNFFEIQRSADGQMWEALDQVKGSGTNNLGSSYAYTDVNPRPGANYYRLRQVDLDGAFSFSDQVRVELSSNSSFEMSAFPNPATDLVTVRMAGVDFKGDWSVAVLDLAGRTLYEKTGENGSAFAETRLDVSTLIPGLYLVRATSGTQIAAELVQIGQ
jgi:hypothetical protein